MAGKSMNLGASSSTSTKTAKNQEKRKKCATRADAAKKPRPFRLIDFKAGPSGTAVVPFHLRGAPSSGSTVPPYPMPGVNGAAPRWSTAATLGRAASRAAAAAAAALPPPVTVGANGHGPAAAPFVLAPAPALQLPGAAAAAASNAAAAVALALPPLASATGASRAPLVVAQAGADGQLVPVPLHFVGYQYHPAVPGLVDSGLPPLVVGIPLAAALDRIENITLGRMLTALMPVCHPPLWHHQNRKGGTPPPWWPTGAEDWWGPELLAHSHLDTVAALTHTPAAPVPFAPSYSLKKAHKVAVLVAIVKHLAPDFGRIAAAVRHSGKLSVSDTDLWYSALNNERAKFMRAAYLLRLPLPQQQGGSGGGGSSGADLSAGSVVVHSSGSAASYVCEPQVAANLPAAGASVSAAPVDGRPGEVIAAAELQVEKEWRCDVDGGVVPVADAPPAGDGRDQPVFNFPAGDGSTQKQGAAVAAAPTAGHVRQVAGGPEMTMQQPEEQHGGVPGNDDVAAAGAENDQVQVHPYPAVDVEEEGHQWWPLNDEELDRMLAEFESFGDVGY